MTLQEIREKDKYIEITKPYRYECLVPPMLNKIILTNQNLNSINNLRNTKELLELMLEHQELFHAGLCNWALYLYDDDLITRAEYRLLRQYIKENKPENAGLTYYWEKGKIAPRIEWINQQIEKL